MKFAVESWDPAYGVSADEQSLEEVREPVDLDVEVSAEAWAPLSPDGGSPPSAVLFIDGVRRIDARVWLSADGPGHVPPSDRLAFDGLASGGLASPGIAFPGMCATVAAGMVRSDPEGARIVAARVERALYTAAPDAGPIVTRHGTYELRPIVSRSSTDDRPGAADAPLHLAIHNHMTALETSLVVDSDRRELVVFDGPLRGRDNVAGVGYIKTQHVQYLPARQHAVVGRLAAGQRTPLFCIGGRFTRWSWYLRLPGPVAHALSGVVRLELPGIGTAVDAAARADAISAVLPRYASEPHKDARAPQNLHPIAGLERELRRRLGDLRLLERALREAS